MCVPTPLTEHREPDLSYVANTAKAVAPWLREGQLVVLESTTYPGTTEELMIPILEEGNKLGLKVQGAGTPAETRGVLRCLLTGARGSGQYDGGAAQYSEGCGRA